MPNGTVGAMPSLNPVCTTNDNMQVPDNNRVEEQTRAYNRVERIPEPIPKNIIHTLSDSADATIVMQTDVEYTERHKTNNQSSFKFIRTSYNDTAIVMTIYDAEARNLFKILLQRYGGEYVESQRKFFGHDDPLKYGHK